ncbi:MAG: LuxR C-terminal-related transcriptional regulator [Actinomycetes bacterium]
MLRPALEQHDGIDVVLDIEDPFDGFPLLEAANPDVVLLWTGSGHVQTVIRALAERLENVKVIVLSGSTTNELVAQAFDAGASGCISLRLPLSAVVEAIAAGGRPRSRPSTAVPTPRRTREPDRSQYLTNREREVLSRIADGESTRGIASDFGVSLATVRTHTQNILMKLGVHSKVEAAAYAVRNNLS